ncbi:MAG TPA: stage II sporulation protein M [Candidatus Binataceae bacterium]|nr:stage II sporulation protein M [Candidatus Binataceae bacterium]
MIVRSRQFQEQLEAVLDRVEDKGARLSFEDTRELARLYRHGVARLSALRTRAGDPEAIRYLNSLCVRAYTRLQVPPARTQRLQRFFLADFPKVLAATGWLQCVVAILMLVGAFAGAAVVAENPAALQVCVPAAFYPPGQLEKLADSRETRAEFLARKPVSFGWKSMFSAALFTHNMTVGVTAFALGILAGIPTLMLAFYNGLTLGAFAWIFSRDSMWPMFWAWMLPHAIPELLAVTLCSTAGLLIGKAIVAPGRHGVATALQESARPALELVAAALPLFIVAAVIESFLRQSTLSSAARFVAAAIALGAIGTYGWYVRLLSRRVVRPELGWLLK